MLATGAALGLLVAVCGGDDDSVVVASGEATTTEARAGDTGPRTGEEEWDAVARDAAGQSLHVYHVVAPALFDNFVEAFNELYPDITVTGERGSTDLLERVDAQIASGEPGADVLINVDFLWFGDHADYFTELLGPNVQEFPERGVQVAGKVYLPTILPFTTIVWNTNEFPDGFQGYEELLRVPPGRIAAHRAPGGNACHFWTLLEEEYGPGYLEELGRLDPIAYTSTSQSAQAVASGEVGVVVSGQPAIALELQDAGAPIDYRVIADPGSGSALLAAALADSPNQEAAQVFMDFLLSSEGQDAFNTHVAFSLLDGVEGAGPVAELTWYNPTDYPDAAAIDTCVEDAEAYVFGQ